MLRLLFVLALARGALGQLLHDADFRVVALRVEDRFREAVVLIGGVVLPFPAIEFFLRNQVLRAVLSDDDFLVLDLFVEIAELGLVLLLFFGAEILFEALALQTHELELEPLPAADIVVHHDHARDAEQQGEDEIQLRHAVVVRDRLLWFQSLPVIPRREDGEGSPDLVTCRPAERHPSTGSLIR